MQCKFALPLAVYLLGCGAAAAQQPPPSPDRLAVEITGLVASLDASCSRGNTELQQQLADRDRQIAMLNKRLGETRTPAVPAAPPAQEK